MEKFTIKARATTRTCLTYDVEAETEEDAISVVEAAPHNYVAAEPEGKLELTDFEVVPPEPEEDNGLHTYNIVAIEKHLVETSYTVEAASEEEAEEAVKEGTVGYETIEIYGHGDDRDFVRTVSVTQLD